MILDEINDAAEGVKRAPLTQLTGQDLWGEEVWMALIGVLTGVEFGLGEVKLRPRQPLHPQSCPHRWWGGSLLADPVLEPCPVGRHPLWSRSSDTIRSLPFKILLTPGRNLTRRRLLILEWGKNRNVADFTCTYWRARINYKGSLVNRQHLTAAHARIPKGLGLFFDRLKKISLSTSWNTVIKS